MQTTSTFSQVILWRYFGNVICFARTWLYLCCPPWVSSQVYYPKIPLTGEIFSGPSLWILHRLLVHHSSVSSGHCQVGTQSIAQCQPPPEGTDHQNRVRGTFSSTHWPWMVKGSRCIPILLGKINPQCQSFLSKRETEKPCNFIRIKEEVMGHFPWGFSDGWGMQPPFYPKFPAASPPSFRHWLR